MFILMFYLIENGKMKTLDWIEVNSKKCSLEFPTLYVVLLIHTHIIA